MTLNGFAQTRIVKGTVNAFKKYPIKNITVKAKKSKEFVLTDAYGNFEIIQWVYPAAKVILGQEQGRRKILIENRGINSVAENSSFALLVVDGIVVDDISSIRPIEVGAVRVLIGNNAAHWGVRGSNGVVEIDLKRGC